MMHSEVTVRCCGIIDCDSLSGAATESYSMLLELLFIFFFFFFFFFGFGRVLSDSAMLSDMAAVFENCVHSD